MNDGEYRLNLVVMSDEARAIYKHADLLSFTILDAPETRNYFYGKWSSAVRPNLKWRTELVEPL